jgi:hypothetical protein
MSGRQWFASVVLLLAIVATGGGLAVWKGHSIDEANAAAARMPEPMESITVAKATTRQYRRSTTAIGTVHALSSITLSNEIAGTVRQVALPPGQVVEADTVLVALDVSVEEAERKAQQAQLALAQSVVGRMEKAAQNHGASDLDVDKARAERDVAAFVGGDRKAHPVLRVNSNVARGDKRDGGGNSGRAGGREEACDHTHTRSSNSAVLSRKCGCRNSWRQLQRVLVIQLLQDHVGQVQAVHLPERMIVPVIIEVFVLRLEHPPVVRILLGLVGVLAEKNSVLELDEEIV